VADIGPESARCGELGAATICFQQMAGQDATTPGVAAVVLGGQPQGSILVTATTVSPQGRPWLVIAAPSQPPASSVSGFLPFDFRVSVDSAVTRTLGEGAYLAYLNVFAGTLLRTRIPVVLRILPGSDVLSTQPDRIDDVSAPAQTAPVIRPVMVEHLDRGSPGPPVGITATPATNDGRGWLTVNTRPTTPPANDRPCALFPTPCGIEVIVTPPPASGLYTGAVTLSDGSRSALLPVRVRITASTVVPPIDTLPGAISLTAPAGSRDKISRSVTVGNNTAGAPFIMTKEASWLEVTPSGPFLPANFVLVADPAGLEPGIYTDTIVLIHAETGSLLALIPVSLSITSPSYLPLLRQGGGWQTSIYLINNGAEEATLGLRFWKSGGGAERAEVWSLTVKDRGPLFAIDDERIPAGGIRVIETNSADARMDQGWAELLAGGPVSIFAVLHRKSAAGVKPPLEATIPVLRAFQEGILAPFDNTGGAVTTLAVVNAADRAVTLRVTVRNNDGAQSTRPPDLTIPAFGQAVLILGDKSGAYPETADRTGTLELTAPGARLVAHAIRNASGALAAFPVAPKAGLSNERGLPLLRYGGGWQTTITAVNPTAANERGGFRFHTASGAALAVPLPDFDAPRDAVAPLAPVRGAFELPIASASRDLAEGWVESAYPATTAGYAILRAAGTAEPASIQTTIAPSSGFPGAVAMPFDNRGGAITALAVANLDAQPTEVQVLVSDRSGRYSAREAGTFRLGARGHAMVRLEDFEQGWEGRAGLVEFRSRSGNRLMGVALAEIGQSATVLPAYPSR
jgi:hypothetical protein